LRNSRSWIPARKSCASLIIGDLAVRPIAVSTSFSIEARLPAMISSSTGSTSSPPPVSVRPPIGHLAQIANRPGVPI
jgi:hypothetical protein